MFSKNVLIAFTLIQKPTVRAKTILYQSSPLILFNHYNQKTLGKTDGRDETVLFDYAFEQAKSCFSQVDCKRSETHDYHNH